MTPNYAIALVHHPVYNRERAIVTTAVTNLDIHDLARLGRTFGAQAVYMVTPVAAQRELVQAVADHWASGAGAQRNPWRSEALQRLRVVDSVAAARAAFAAVTGETPLLVCTSAVGGPRTIEHGAARSQFAAGVRPPLILFGTGWGLDAQLVRACDLQLAPVFGVDGYNHLPVRAAVAIILDRLFGVGRNETQFPLDGAPTSG